MTYEEAIEIISSNICYNLLGCMDGICKHTDEKPCAVQMAREALEKQTPKRPKRSKREIRYCEVWECPCCGFEWSSRIVDFCYKCGQAIDWSEKE